MRKIITKILLFLLSKVQKRVIVVQTNNMEGKHHNLIHSYDNNIDSFIIYIDGEVKGNYDFTDTDIKIS